MLFFSGIAVVVILGIMALFSSGTNLFTRGRQISASQNDMRILLEYLSEDAAELVYLDGDKYDSTGSGQNFSFVIKSSRKERGFSTQENTQGLRRIQYSLEGTGKLRSLARTVTRLDDAGNAGGGGEKKTVLVRDGFKHLKIWGIAAIPTGATGQPWPSHKLKVANQDSKVKGATVACLVVDACAGEPGSEKAVDKQSQTHLVTRVWCRNRILEVSRGALK